MDGLDSKQNIWMPAPSGVVRSPRDQPIGKHAYIVHNLLRGDSSTPNHLKHGPSAQHHRLGELRWLDEKATGCIYATGPLQMEVWRVEGGGWPFVVVW